MIINHHPVSRLDLFAVNVVDKRLDFSLISAFSGSVPFFYIRADRTDMHKLFGIFQ
jgi:hypothetical protein